MANFAPTSAFWPQDAAPPVIGAQRPKPSVSAATADAAVPAVIPATNTTINKSFVFMIPPFWVYSWDDEIHLLINAYRLKFLHHFCSDNWFQVSGFGCQEN
jgi:hypothetical protein